MDNLTLLRWHSLDAAETVQKLCDYAKRDAAYSPVGASGSSRWHVRVGNDEFELVLTGQKYWDTRAQRGGGGAIDLAMHLFGGGFRRAARMLKDAGL